MDGATRLLVDNETAGASPRGLGGPVVVCQRCCGMRVIGGVISCWIGMPARLCRGRAGRCSVRGEGVRARGAASRCLLVVWAAPMVGILMHSS